MSLKKHFHRAWRFFLKNYFGYLQRVDAVSKTHGVQHIMNNSLHPFERILWIFIVITAFCGAIVIANIQFTRFMANPTVISLERDYHDWNGTMPAVTFCYANRLTTEAVEFFLEEKFNVTPSDQDFFYFYEFVEAVVNISILNLRALDEFAYDERLQDTSFLEITQFVVPVFEQYISSFDKTVQLDAVPIITEKGLCYSVNSPLSHLLAVEQDHRIRKPLSCKFSISQCFLKIDVYGFQLSSVFVHSPFEVPLADTLSFAMEPTDEITSTYKIVETIADDSLRELSVRQRKCLFQDEQIRGLPSYSVNLCLMECRAAAALHFCSCKPFFYPFIEGPVCGIDGIFCLNRISWPDNVKNSCNCPKSCRDLLFLRNTFKVENWDVGEEGIPFAQKSTFRLEILPPRMRHRREVLFTFEDLLVSLGAATSLFLGISFYNMLHGAFVHIEILYEIIRWCRVMR
ncbi:sodium channel protein Nach-like [Phlebotomus argentipes]|uniref:sodium channel protein Nach-like n=1 Tax=Phlebotomus argentipes TaxID=94469 RepID=UPI002892A5D8|nr:sodium channel protein Nach-like [Phlebotomus argentipes]